MLAAALAKGAGDVVVSKGDRGVVFQFDGQTWALRERDGHFPEWRALTPDTDSNVEFTVDAREVARAASLIGDLQGGGRPMAVEITPRGVVAVALLDRETRAEVGLGATISAAPRGGMNIGLDPEYLRSIAATVESGPITVEAIGPLRPVTFTAGADLFLLMPMRLTV